jgi:hypothetical protein
MGCYKTEKLCTWTEYSSAVVVAADNASAGNLLRTARASGSKGRKMVRYSGIVYLSRIPFLDGLSDGVDAWYFNKENKIK